VTIGLTATPPSRWYLPMDGNSPKPIGRKQSAADRQQRLARALRENLRRRKEQARAQRPPRSTTSERLPPG
jgi:hypothetical protein